MTNTPSAKHLIDYVAAGYELIPLHRWDAKTGKGTLLGKAPRDKGWPEKAYEHDALVTHVRKGGNFGVRLRPADLILDVDPRNFPEGEDMLARLQADFDLDLDAYPHVVTGSGGHHFYMRKPSDLEILETIAGYPGIEFKTMGRQVVAVESPR